MYNNNTGRSNSRRTPKDEQNNRRDRGKRGKDESQNYDSRPDSSSSNGNETGGIGEDREKKSAMLYNLWQQSSNSNNSNSRGNSRGNDNRNNARSSERKSSKPQNILNRTPTLQDLNRVIFGTNANFEINEIVLAPRTRGGFSYAKITKQLTKTHCFFDPLIEHKCTLYRVVYHNQGKALFKDLPSPHIGKFPDSNRDVQPSYEPSPDQDFSRTVGDKPSLKDLQVVVFSAQCTFASDEMVLVPRSNGGFTYGRIYKEAQQNCKLESSSTHSLQAWRIIVNEDNPSNVTRKDLSIPLIGKITFTNTEIVIPKNRMALFKMCEEIPNMENAAKKESEIISDDEAEENSQENSSSEDISDEVVVYNPTADPSVPSDTATVPSADTTASVQTAPPAPTLQVGGILAIDKEDLLRKLMTPKIKQPILEESKHLIVLDGPNVATKHGKDQEFSTEGISIALKYWNDRGHDCIAFLPEHYVRRKPGQTVTLKEFMPKVKNLPLIMDLIDKGKVVLTPPQDYDDSYVIEYAMGHGGCIVTNDRYWDHIEKAAAEKGQRAKKETLKWIRDHLISFTFVRDEFLPNPNFKFPQEESK